MRAAPTPSDEQDPAERRDHEVRNALAVIRGNAQLLRRRAERDPARELPRGAR